MEKLVVIDGNSIMNRAFYGLSGRNMLSTKEGIPTNALFGFLSILFKIIGEDNPDYMAVAFDLKEPTFRHKMYDKYKANRHEMPQELRTQMPLIKEILDAMNIKRLEISGFEADDILGTLSVVASNQEIEVILFTGDRDAFQLVKDRVVVKLPSTKAGKTETELYDIDKINEKYGLEPKALIQVKALMGDSSDNIPGVKGIGEKTALKYIQKFGDIENLYNNLQDEIIKKRARELLEEYKEDAYMSRTLAEIDTKVPINFSKDEYKISGYKNKELYNIFKKLEFTNFIKKLELTGIDNKQEEFKIDSFEVITDIEKLNKKLNKNPVVAVYIEDIAKKEYISEIEKIAFYNKEGFIYKIQGDKKEFFKELFENQDVEKIMIDSKELYLLLRKEDIVLRKDIIDLAIIEYILDSTRTSYNLIDIARQRLDIDISKFTKESQNQMSLFSDTSLDDETMVLMAKVLFDLKQASYRKIEEQGQVSLLNDIELPLVRILADMQYLGIEVKKEELILYSKYLQGETTRLEEEIYGLSGEKFNINSPKQLGDILFNKLGLKSTKKTHTGYKTDAETLLKFRDEHEIIDKVLLYKQYMKLKSTYADGLYNAVDDKTGRIHSNFKQTVTATGRLSSTEPNLQNIPIKVYAGRKIRKSFVPKAGYTFIDADYSQIELRILADMSEDEALIYAFNNDEDIHTSTAMKIFNLSKDTVTKEHRAKAKAVNFGIVYGQGEFSLSEDLGISIKEAKEYIASYFESFPKIKEFMDSLIERATLDGFAQTLYNRRRYIPELKSSNFHVRAFGKRVAMNMPIQGTAADIIKIAMKKVYEKLLGMKSKLILQIHDELVIETAEDEIDRVQEIVKSSMEEAVALKVRLKVDLNIGKSLFDTK